MTVIRCGNPSCRAVVELRDGLRPAVERYWLTTAGWRRLDEDGTGQRWWCPRCVS